MGFSGVLGAASKVDDGEGADDDSAENDVNSLMKPVIAADQSISGEASVELSEQNDTGEVDTSGGRVTGGNCSKLKSSNDPRSFNE